MIFLVLQDLYQAKEEELLFFAMQIINVVDSMPIIVAQRGRSYTAKVAADLCNRGFCASKKMSYYGLKLHVLGFARRGKLPIPEWIGISPASYNDLTVFKPIFEQLFNRAIYADKIYQNAEFQRWLLGNNQTEILSPVKLKKGQKKLPIEDKLYSQLVSKIRQPIEGFFAWIIEKTKIQKASKVRSSNGLIVHVFGRLTAAIMMMTFDFL